MTHREQSPTPDLHWVIPNLHPRNRSQFHLRGENNSPSDWLQMLLVKLTQCDLNFSNGGEALRQKRVRIAPYAAHLCLVLKVAYSHCSVEGSRRV